MLPEVALYRTETGDHGTFGIWVADGLSCFTAELPWRENAVGLSCIPAGRYEVRVRRSPRYGAIYHVTNVEGRTWILAHWGNLAGDVQKGFKTHVQGCILLGSALGFISKQRAVLNSRLTVKKFMRHMNNQPFMLTVVDPFHQEMQS